MATTTISLRALSEDAARAVAADCHGPVIVTEEGRPAHVVLSYETYRVLVQGETERHTTSARAEISFPPGASLIDVLALPGLEIIPDELEFRKAEFHFQIPDLTD